MPKPVIPKKILLTQVGCVVSPYRRGQSYMIERYTGQYDKVYHRYNEYVGFVVPYGGSISYVTYRREKDFYMRALPEYSIEEMPLIPGKRIAGKSHGFINIDTFRTVQTEVITQLNESKRYNNVWFVNMQTNAGKTILSAHMSMEIGLKTWVCCYSKGILDQWQEMYCNKTDIDDERILRVNGRIIDKILSGELNPDDYDIFMSTPKVLDKLGDDRSDYWRLNNLFTKCGIGLFIYDEAHRWLSDFVKITSCTNPRYILALSADYGQASYDREEMFRKVFRNALLITPSVETAISMKYTKVCVVYYDSYPTEIEKNEIFNRYGFSGQLFGNYEYRKGTMLKAILYVLHAMMDNMIEGKAYRSLVLFQNVANVDGFYEICKKHFPGRIVGKYHGQVKDADKAFTKDHAEIIIATYGSFSTGLHSDNIKYVISTNQCNKVADNQSAGRASALSDGTDSVYYMLVDSGHKYCLRKLKLRLAYLLETKAKGEIVNQFTYHPDIYPIDIE